MQREDPEGRGAACDDYILTSGADVSMDTVHAFPLRRVRRRGTGGSAVLHAHGEADLVPVTSGVPSDARMQMVTAIGVAAVAAQ